MKYPVKFDLEFKKNSYGGLYIAIEGIDGSGKSTQVKELEKFYTERGKEVVITAEPSRSGEVGELIHRVLQQDVSIPSVAIQYLFSADRAVNYESLIIPSLKSGKIVISDRSFWSSVPYGILDRRKLQEGSEAPDQMLVALSILSFYHQFLAPDITFYLDVPVKTASSRLQTMDKKSELYEKAEFLEDVKKTYDWIIKKFEGAFITLDGTRGKEEVLADIVKKIQEIK